MAGYIKPVELRAARQRNFSPDSLPPCDVKLRVNIDARNSKDNLGVVGSVEIVGVDVDK